MPVLQIQQGNPFNTTVQMIFDAVSADLRQQISSEHANLLDYVNRISFMIQRHSRWKFLLSPVQRFITQAGQTDYWIGNIGQQPLGSADSGLGLTDVGIIKIGTVFDRSNFRNLDKTDEPPANVRLFYQDATGRPGRPLLWRNSPDTPYIINLYPPPDNQNTMQPVPPTPYCQVTGGGSLPPRIYYVWTTYVDSMGNEGSASGTPTGQPAKIFVPDSSLLVVNPPEEPALTGATGIAYDRWNVYVGTSIAGRGALQNGSTPISNLTTWQEPTTGLLTATRNAPTNSLLEPIDGYMIEFRYFKQRQLLQEADQIIAIPDDYRDVVIAGVNWLAAKYAGIEDLVEHWGMLYKEGLASMIHDKNLFPRGQEFITPDAASITRSMPSIEGFDSNLFPFQ